MANYFGMTGVGDGGLGDMLRDQTRQQSTETADEQERKRRLRLQLGQPNVSGANRLGLAGLAQLGGFGGRGYGA